MTTETVVLWSDAETWLGFAPGNGDDVVVPRGLTVTLDADTPALGTLAVRGTLRASDEIDLRLTADNVLVFGALEIGTVDRPHTREFEIVLTGGAADPHIVLADWAGLRGRVIGSSAGPMTEPLPPKALIVAPGGRLDLHGADVRSWTRLEGTAPAGSTSIEVRDARGWMVGDTIAIAPTGLDAFEVEERVVTAIDGTVIGLDEPLTYAHFGMRQILPDGDLLDMRAEVANLSRNIAIQGEADPNESELTTGTGSEHADAFARTAHGGHVTVLGGAVARIAGAEFADLGISGTAGRHALWFQHGGDRAGSYVMSASIHHTFRGGIVVDRTDNLLIEENVVYDVMGHGIQLKEGGANGNRFDGNLVMMPRSTEDAFDPKASRTRPPGGAASGFQIDSGENAFAGNHVAGVPSGQGFQFGASDTSMEPASDGDPRVGEAKLLQFADNIAHTIMTDGEIVDRLDDDRGRSGVGLDIAAPLAPGSAPIEGFTAWMIGDAGVALPHKATAAFEDLLVADVRQAIRPAGTSVDIDGFTFVVASDNSPDGIDPKAIFVAGGLRGPMLGTFMAPSTVKGLRILRDDALAGTMDDAASLENLTLRPNAAGNGLTSLAGLPQVFPTTAQGEERDVRSTPSHGEDSVGTKGDDTVLDGGRRDAAWAFGDDEPTVDDMMADIPADRDEVATSPQDVEPGAAVRTVFHKGDGTGIVEGFGADDVALIWYGAPDRSGSNFAPRTSSERPDRRDISLPFDLDGGDAISSAVRETNSLGRDVDAVRTQADRPFAAAVTPSLDHMAAMDASASDGAPEAWGDLVARLADAFDDGPDAVMAIAGGTDADDALLGDDPSRMFAGEDVSGATGNGRGEDAFMSRGESRSGNDVFVFGTGPGEDIGTDLDRATGHHIDASTAEAEDLEDLLASAVREERDAANRAEHDPSPAIRKTTKDSNVIWFATA